MVITMNTRQLRYFLAVLDHGGVRRGAEAVHVSQPALTRQLRDLESELGVELFKRSPGSRQNEITEAGRIVLDQARIVDGALRAIRSRIDRLKADSRSRVCVGTIGRSGAYLLLTALSRFQLTYSGANVTVRSCGSDPSAELLSGEVDFTVGIDLMEGESPQLQKEVIFSDSFVVVASQSVARKLKRARRLEDLMDQRWVFWLGAGIPRSAIDRALPWPRGRTPKDALITDSPQIEHSLIENDGRLGIWSRGAQELMRPGSDIVTLQTDFEPVRAPVVITYPAGKEHSPANRRLIENVRAIGQQLSQCLQARGT
jgi:DNA-binding transcriptional LysR family regulator